MQVVPGPEVRADDPVPLHQRVERELALVVRPAVLRHVPDHHGHGGGMAGRRDSGMAGRRDGASGLVTDFDFVCEFVRTCVLAWSRLLDGGGCWDFGLVYFLLLFLFLFPLCFCFVFLFYSLPNHLVFF